MRKALPLVRALVTVGVTSRAFGYSGTCDAMRCGEHHKVGERMGVAE